jgi:menaquinone-dependent protoporphyrinogen oxidase
MNVLVIYATIEGQTRKIAETIAADIEALGGHAGLMNVAEMSEYGLERPDGVILCAPIHVGRYPSPFVDFVHREVGWLNSLPTAFVSVTLAIHSSLEDERSEAEQFPAKVMELTGWKPLMIHHAAGALRFTEYDFFKRWMMRRISEKEGGPVDTRSDHEFTDWDAIRKFVEDFMSSASGAPAKSATTASASTMPA